jgi:hypothetical protein
VVTLGDIDGDGYDDLGFTDGKHSWYWGLNYYVVSSKDLEYLDLVSGGKDGQINYSNFKLGPNSYEFTYNTSTNISNGLELSATNPLVKDFKQVGDFDGDGRADLMFGNQNEGRVWLVSTRDLEAMDRASGSMQQPRANDNLINLSTGTSAGSQSYTFTGLNLGFKVLGLGDVDGDGKEDFYMSTNNTGYVVMNKDLQLLDAADGSTDRTINLLSNWNAAGTTGYRITNVIVSPTTESNYWAGTALELVSTAGDMDGDGRNDFLIGSDLGTIVIYSSQLAASDAADGTLNRSFALQQAKPAGANSMGFVGTAGNDVIGGSTSNDLLVGNGGADQILAAAGDDTIVLNASNVSSLSNALAFVDGGTGTDTLKLDGAGITLDLTALQNKVMGIEKIDLTGSGNNTLKLSLADVLAVTDTDRLFVTGNAGDTVQIIGADVTPSVATVGGVSYNVFSLDSTHHLYVQQSVTAVLA